MKLLVKVKCVLFADCYLSKLLKTTFSSRCAAREAEPASLVLYFGASSSKPWEAMFGDALAVEVCGLKLRQRLVASKTFYRDVVGRFNTVMLQNETNIFLRKKIVNRNSVRFGKSRRFFRMQLTKLW